jgi:phosphatidylinositol-3-phosphatase
MSLTRSIAASVLAASIASGALAAEGPVPTGVARLDHVFIIMMENHSFDQVVNNPTMPFINRMIAQRQVSLSTGYFAVGHPSLTNYLEIVGGSNFGVRSDNSPDWHNTSCQPNLATRIPNADNGSGTYPHPIDTGKICPIAGVGTDQTTEAVDDWNETSPPVFNYLANIDGVRSIQASSNIVGKTIGDQLASAGLSWKTYQESLPATGADGINLSNGFATNLTTFDPNAPLSATNLPPLTSGGIVAAYAVKHNPFAYFQSVQEGTLPNSSLHNMMGFDGPHGLYTDLATGDLPSLSYIVPNQCDDQHGRGNSDAFCQEDQGIPAYQGLTNGTLLGMNPGLSEQADNTIEKLVTSIKASPAWHHGHNAIVIVWDENDYSGLAKPWPATSRFPRPNQNNVVLTVETSDSRRPGIKSEIYYNAFSLLRTLEGGFRLPCLNHACDKGQNVMTDLFGG